MFHPTHTYHYADGSNNKRTWPNGIPVIRGNTYEDGCIEWLADCEGNIGGYSIEGASYVVPLNQE